MLQPEGVRQVSHPLWLLAGLSLVLLLGLVACWGVATDLSAEGMLGVLLVLFALVDVAAQVVCLPRRGWGIDLCYPPTLYGVLYALYHFLPYLLALSTGLIPIRYQLPVGGLLFLGYFGWRVGIYLSPLRSRRPIPTGGIGRSDSLALLIVCALASVLIAGSVVWRVRNGSFYTHAAYFEQDPTVEASILSVVASELQLPVLLILGLLSQARDKPIARFSRNFLWGYSGAMFLVFVLSSQTRPAITVLLFFLLSLGLYRPFLLRPHHAIVLGGLGVAAVLTIQGMRSSKAPSSGNQFAYALTHAVDEGLGAASRRMPEVVEGLHSRACGSSIFLSEILDACEVHPHLHGSGVLASLPGLIPRTFWPDKPTVEAPQIVYEEMLGSPVHDAALTSVCQFYADWGYLGVAAGHLVLGWLAGAFLQSLMLRPRVFTLLVFFFLCSHIAQMESEIVLGCLATLRIAIAFYILYRLIALYFPVDEQVIARRDAGGGRSGTNEPQGSVAGRVNGRSGNDPFPRPGILR
jgi:hypothetical protein